MLVHQILKSKGIDSVITVEPGSSVADAARILSEKRIGTVVISADGRHAEGILSERDIVREVGRRGPDCLSDTVDQMMTRNPHTCARDESADSVLERMTEGRFRHLPVVENGDLVGFVSIGDLVKFRFDQVQQEAENMRSYIQTA